MRKMALIREMLAFQVAEHNRLGSRKDACPEGAALNRTRREMGDDRDAGSDISAVVIPLY